MTLLPKHRCGLCPDCGRLSDTIQRRSESDPVKDLPLGPYTVELIIRVYQFACTHCGRFFTPPFTAFAPGAHATERFLAQAAHLIRFSDIANAAAFFAVPEKSLERWYYDPVLEGERLLGSRPPLVVGEYFGGRRPANGDLMCPTPTPITRNSSPTPRWRRSAWSRTSMHGELTGALRTEMSYFVDCVARGTKPTVVTPVEARTAVAAASAAEKSAASGTVVRL